MQIVNGNTALIDTMKNKSIGPGEVLEKFGVEPKKVIDVQALAGDSSDNVPGAPGIGIKTAATLINEYGNLENLLKNCHQIKQNKRRETLENFQEQILISKELVTLKKDVSDIPTIDKLQTTKANISELITFLSDLELNKLADRIKKKNPNVDLSISKNKISSSIIEKKLIDKKEIDQTSNQKTNYLIINDEGKLEEIVNQILKYNMFVFDVETDSLDVQKANLVGISICFNIENSFYIPIGHQEDIKQLGISQIINKLAPLFKSESIIKVGHNIKFDIAILQKYEIHVNSIDDTMLMSLVCDAGINRHNMDDLAKIHLNRDTIKFKDIVGSGKSQLTFDQVKISEAINYAAEDSEITFRLYKLLKKRILNERNASVYYEIERPLINSILKMETSGMKVDNNYLKKLSDEFKFRIQSVEKKIFKLAGKEFNIGSPKQLSEILFDHLKLNPPKKTKSGERSTGIEVLEDLAYEGNKIAEHIIGWRQISKLRSTYSEALQNHISQETGRIHTSFSMASTNTGRLASSDPNLQNIPIRTDEGRSIRKAFIAEKNKTIFSADYSQIELRVLAHIANVEQLKEAFNNNDDIHKMTASEIFNIKMKDVTSDLRRQAKAVNFGIIYGISAYGLAKQLGISNFEASDFIKKYFNRFSGIKDFMESTKELCRQNGYVETLCGRKCFFPRIKDKNFALRSFQERAAINAPIQGTAADIIKYAMIKIDKKLNNDEDCKMILQVHDELIFEIQKSKIEKFSKLIIDEMQNALEPHTKLSIPLIVDSNSGKNWNEAH
jgi:DNA polymerase-1